jgi:hypothetical protein
MLFIGLLVFIVAAALVFAGYAVSCELQGVERTRSWVRSAPRRLKCGSLRFLRAVLFVQPADAAASRSGSSIPRAHRPPPPAPARPAPRRGPAPGRQSSRRPAGQFGGREALQLLGLALLVGRAAGWIDLDDTDEAAEELGLGGAEEAFGSELPPNPGDQFVNPYVREGRVVEGYYRTNADATELNNYGGPLGKLFRMLNGRA